MLFYINFLGLCVSLSRCSFCENNVFIIDYKLPGSGMALGTGDDQTTQRLNELESETKALGTSPSYWAGITA